MKILTVLKADEARTQYDQAAKTLIGSKETLARILQGTMKEFADMEVKDIIPCIESVETGRPMNPGMMNSESFRGMNPEDYQPGEGRVFFDFLTRVMTPGCRYLIEVNVEINNRTDRWKVLIPRSVYYSSRILSSQGDRDFSIKHHEYDKTHKAVSIWISLDMPDSQADRIIRFALNPEFIYGDPFELSGNYDLLEIIPVTVGKTKSSSNKLTGFLYSLLSNHLKYVEKIELLTNEFRMVIKDREREALVTMDGLYDGYILKYFAEGEAQGLKTGGSKKIIKLIQRKLDKGRSFEQACAELDLTEEEIEEIRPEFTR